MKAVPLRPLADRKEESREGDERIDSPREARAFCGGISLTMQKRLIKAGAFPQPVVILRNRHGRPRRIGFVHSELVEYNRRLIAARDRSHEPAQADEEARR
jgi:predicted DNA-binding transcriptional regulator AlpA